MLDVKPLTVDDFNVVVDDLNRIDEAVDGLTTLGVVFGENLCVTAYLGDVVPANMGLNTGLYDQVGVVDVVVFDVVDVGFCNAMAVSMRNGGNVDVGEEWAIWEK